jgi:hypothetical protein
MANIKKNEAKKEIDKKSARREKTKVDETFDGECSNPVDDDCGCTIDACGCVDTCMCC